MLPRWDELDPRLQVPVVEPYFRYLDHRRLSLGVKRGLDLLLTIPALIVLAPFLAVLALVILIADHAPPFYMSTRITTNFRPFRLIKFRTMRAGPGSSVTVRDDPRVTRVGRWLRHYRLDELPQLINVVRGDMTLVGIRPEAPVFVDAYTPEMRATLLLPAGLTSPASIDFLDEHQLLSGGDPHAKYVTVILPQKMSLNLEYLRTYGILRDIHIVFETAFRMVFRDR